MTKAFSVRFRAGKLVVSRSRNARVSTALSRDSGSHPLRDIERRVMISGRPRGADLRRIVDVDLHAVAPPENGLVISAWLAHILGVHVAEFEPRTIAALGTLLMPGIGRRGRVLRFLVWAISAALRPRALLVAENVCLRQQLGALQRRHRQPRLRNGDRQFWICASRWFGGWRNSLLYCKARDSSEVASTRLACLLVLAVKSGAEEGATTNFPGASGTHPADDR